MARLYQQGVQRIEIVVRKEDGGGGGATTMRKPKEKTADQIANANRLKRIYGTTNPKRIKRIIHTNAMHGFATARNVSNRTINYIITNIGNRYGDQALQENAQRVIEIADDASGFATNVIMGASFGSWGGPLGTVLGAMFGAINSGTTIAYKYAAREREFNFKMFKENNAIQYNRARAGISLTTGRLR